jgi:DNA polymerase III subunit epsilon
MKAHRPAAPSRWFLHHSWTKAPLVALDFETTGLDLRRDVIISYGVVPIVDGGIDLGKAQYREVNPTVPPSNESITVHHLRPVDLREAPSMRETRYELSVMLERAYIVTWVEQVEANFLATVFGGGALSWMRRTVDAYRMIRAVEQLRDPDAQVGSLEETAERYGVPVEEAHHALDDAVMTAELFLVAATKLAAAGGDDRLRTLRRAARASRVGLRT